MSGITTSENWVAGETVTAAKMNNIISTAVLALTAHDGDLTFANANPEILGRDTDGVLYIGPSTTNALGGNIILYGDTHATKAKDIDFRATAGIELHYDDSASKWDFQANAIDTSGAVTFSGGGALTGTWSDLGTVTTIDINGGTITGITDLVVADGGTGLSATTAYAVLCGGTTTTAALQSIAGLGSATQVLTSNGAAALPTFQDVPASGDDLDVITVGTNGDHTTIQAAIDAAAAGDTILVAEGTYTETITYDLDNLNIIATGSRSNTTITQAAATVVVFGTSSGCLLKGFTVTVTAADGAADYVIHSNNDGADTEADFNRVIDCNIELTSTVLTDGLYAIYAQDGNFELKDCRVYVNDDYASTTSQGVYIIYTAAASHTRRITGNDIIGDFEQTGVGTNAGMYLGGTGTYWIRDNNITLDSTIATTGYLYGIYSTAANTTHLTGNYIYANASSTGECAGLRLLDGTLNSYRNFFNITNGDTDADWVLIAASKTYNSYGDKVINGDLNNSGTYNVNKAWVGVVAAETNEALFSHKLTVDINGTSYGIMMIAL